MAIDTILCTYNRSDRLGPAIDSFVAATVPAGVTARLLVVDNNSRDDTAAVLARYAAAHPGRILALSEPRQGKCHGLNTAVGHATAEVIAFYDDDERLAPDWLCVLARNFADPIVDYVGGEMRPDWQQPPPAWFPPGYKGVIGIVQNGPERREYRSPGFTGMPVGGNYAIRRSVLDRCGPFSDRLMYAEDRYMYIQLQRVGARGWYDPDLLVMHDVPVWRLTKRYYRHWAFTEGRNNARAMMDEQGRHIIAPPRWMLARAAQHAVGLVRGERAGDRFQAQLQAIELAGFAMECTARLRLRDRTEFTTPAE